MPIWVNSLMKNILYMFNQIYLRTPAGWNFHAVNDSKTSRARFPGIQAKIQGVGQDFAGLRLKPFGLNFPTEDSHGFPTILRKLYNWNSSLWTIYIFTFIICFQVGGVSSMPGASTTPCRESACEQHPGTTALGFRSPATWLSKDAKRLQLKGWFFLTLGLIALWPFSRTIVGRFCKWPKVPDTKPVRCRDEPSKATDRWRF